MHLHCTQCFLQSCTEMVMPMCQNGTDMFEVSPWNFTKVSDDCAERFFGIRPKKDWAMINYGGDRLKAASNIIFRFFFRISKYLHTVCVVRECFVT